MNPLEEVSKSDNSSKKEANNQFYFLVYALTRILRKSIIPGHFISFDDLISLLILFNGV